MDSGTSLGVGIRGMRERLRQLGGTLEVNSNGEGTVVIARLPLLVLPCSPHDTVYFPIGFNFCA